MKTIQSFLAILLFTALTNCNNDDDSNNQPANQQNTSWSLTHVVGGIAGADQTFPDGLIQWTFNEDTHMLLVENDNTDEAAYDFFDSGTYPYTLENNGTDEILAIDGIEFGAVTETPTELTIDQQVDDGFLITLSR